MSRPIKFRAQDKHGVWHYSDGKEYHPAFIGPAIFWRGIEIGSLRKDTLGEFTGLHDKNGKEAWESDIVRYWGDNDQIQEMEIDFQDGCFMVDGTPLCDIGDFEVIRNIYEA